MSGPSDVSEMCPRCQGTKRRDGVFCNQLAHTSTDEMKRYADDPNRLLQLTGASNPRATRDAGDKGRVPVPSPTPVFALPQILTQPFKVFRPGRWSRAALEEEVVFLEDLRTAGVAMVSRGL